MSGKKLGLDKLYKNLYTNKMSFSDKMTLQDAKVIDKKTGKTHLSKGQLDDYVKNQTSSYFKKMGKLEQKYIKQRPGMAPGNIFKSAFRRSPIGRIADLTIKVGSGIGIGYNMAKEKFKPDNKMGGGMMYGYETGGMSSKQKAIAAKAPPPNVLDGKDFAVLRAEKAKNRGMGLQDESMKPGKIMKAKYGKEAKIKKVMKEFKKGELHIGKSKKKVKNKKQAIAIALSEARKGKA